MARVKINVDLNDRNYESIDELTDELDNVKASLAEVFYEAKSVRIKMTLHIEGERI